MCSIGEDDFGDDGGVHSMVAELETASIGESESTCNKCGSEGAVCKLKFREAECQECFLAYVRHKFRAALGSSKILPRNADIIVVFDGSAEAMVLVDMLHYALTQNAFKKLHCSLRILYVDEYALNPHLELNEYEQQIVTVQNFLAPYKEIDSYVVPIGQEHKHQTVYKLQNVAEYLERDTNVEKNFTERVLAMKSLTSRQDYVKRHRNRLIGMVAAQFDCGFAFLSDISSTLATDLLSAVALGRGGSAAFDVALLDDRCDANVKLIRPIRDLNNAEVQLYLQVQRLVPLQIWCYSRLDDSTASLQNLTKAFVNNLQQNFSSTVSTVFRTGNKIAPNSELEHSNEQELSPLETCVICRSPLDCEASTTLLAIEFSRLVSAAGTTKQDTRQIDNFTSVPNDDELKDLCHACRNMQRECNLDLIKS